MKLAMKATSLADVFEKKVSLLYILVHGTRNISDMLLLNRTLQFKTLNLFTNLTFLTLHVYMLKERTFQISIFIALPIEDGKIDQNVDCYYIISLNYGSYYILVLYLTHVAQISDRSTGFVVEPILRDPGTGHNGII